MVLGKVPVERDDLIQALAFARVWFARWMKRGWVQADQERAILDEYADWERRLQAGESVPTTVTVLPADVCWSCSQQVPASSPACSECGAPVRTGDATAWRYLVFLCHEVARHRDAGRLTLAAADDCLADARGRMAAARSRMDRERVPLANAAAADLGASEPLTTPPLLHGEDEQREPRTPRVRSRRPPPRRNLLEVLLDPRSIQWMLAGGGALLVLGLLIWLWAEGIFQNKVFVAVLLGSANAALLAAGWALIRLTRHETAGRALTLLACLLMPFNLWFYDAQGLITLAEGGGHLWIPALVCCLLYGISARLLRDPTFVYVLAAGVAGTGLLLLADHDIGRFWEISAPSTLLVVLGFLGIHAERFFPDDDGAFSRKRFGLASFLSGHVLLGAGLLLVLGAQIAGDWLWQAFKPLYDAAGAGTPQIVASLGGRVLALALVLVGTYLYAYSDLVVRRSGVFIHVAVGTLLWAEVLVIRMFEWPIPVLEVVIIALAVTGFLANLALTTPRAAESRLMRAGPALALGLSILPVVLGVIEHYSATALPEGLRHPLTASYVVAMIVTAVACRVAAFLYRQRQPGLSLTYFFGTGAATMAGAAGLLLVAFPERSRWEDQAPILMVIPLLYLLASRLYGERSPARPLMWVAHAATVVMLVSSIGATSRGFLLVKGETLNLALAGFFAEAALFYGLEAAWRRRAASVYACTVSACAAVWQLLQYSQVGYEYSILCFAALGLVLLVSYRFAILERVRVPALAKAAFQCANGLLTVAFAGGALLTLGELLGDPARQKTLLTLTAALAAIGVAAIILVRQESWRRWYAAMSITHAVLFLLVLAILSNLTHWQRLELVCVALGTCLLISAHVGWYREQEEHADLVSIGLVMGSLLLVLPLTITVVSCRVLKTFDTFHTVNEIGMLAAGLFLLATGVVFRIRATTVGGGFLMGVFLLTLVLYVRWPEQLQTTAVYIMIGGGLVFLAGLLLSLYRDRLLALPERIKRREGIFKVLSWR
jgi:hypothetical protein